MLTYHYLQYNVDLFLSLTALSFWTESLDSILEFIYHSVPAESRRKPMCYLDCQCYFISIYFDVNINFDSNKYLINYIFRFRQNEIALLLLLLAYIFFRLLPEQYQILLHVYFVWLIIFCICTLRKLLHLLI